MPRRISESDPFEDSIGKGIAVPRSSSKRRLNKAKVKKARSLSPSTGMKDIENWNLDDDSLAEVKAFFRDIKVAQLKSSKAHSSNLKTPRSVEGDAPMRTQSPKSSRKDLRSMSASEPILDLAAFAMSSDESVSNALNVQLDQHPVLDFSRARSVTPIPRSAAAFAKVKKSSSSSSIRGEDMTYDPQMSMRWQDIAQRSPPTPAKQSSSVIQDGELSPFKEYVTLLAQDPTADNDESENLCLRIMNESDPNNDAKSMDPMELFNLLNNSSHLTLNSDRASASEDGVAVLGVSLSPPRKLLSAMALLAYLENDNNADKPQQCSEMRDRHVSGRSPVLTPAEMADILHHVVMNHGINDDIRWDVIARMARDVGNEDFDALPPFECVGGSDADDDSSVSSISEGFADVIDERAEFWNSGGGLQWNPEEFFY